MRLDFASDAFDAIQEELFEDVLYTPAGGGAAVTLLKAIFGVEIASARPEVFDQTVRVGTHLTRASKAKFAGIAKGALIKDGTAPEFDDGTEYRVVDVQPAGDGRLEIEISLVVNS
ncbi:MAG: hypothetical protein HY834_08935 [Devosia nanyangense]|uniref:Uncharacterized protein n=1 Tax=Devosia nanyangense TaxID=1228055 RepID=A0A933NYA4_9HYPH|nr:hypothetical protein [Devosia nanyangense]